MLFQHTAARRRLDWALFLNALGLLVSTHSRPKAAGPLPVTENRTDYCFNTQPPEGGWPSSFNNVAPLVWFQHTAARRRLVTACAFNAFDVRVSTHSRPKAAGNFPKGIASIWRVSTHSRPKAAGHSRRRINSVLSVSTHSRPKAAGQSDAILFTA